MSTRMGKGDPTVNNDSAPKSQSGDAAATAESVFISTGLSEIEWASAWLPVQAVEQGLDLQHDLQAGLRTRTITRTDLAARLGVDAKQPIGAQLVSKGKLSDAEGRFVDEGLFKNRLLELQLRLYGTADDAINLERSLRAKGLIERMDINEESEKSLFITLLTENFYDLAKFLSNDSEANAVLIAIDDSAVCI